MVSSKPGSSKEAKISDNASKKVKGENFYHNAKTAGRLKMKGGKPVATSQKGEDETAPGRVQPDRRWFCNTRLPTKKHDSYSVLLRCNKPPMALLDDASNSNLRKVRGRSSRARGHED
ncbi:hypothetical protein BDM02DRAFT_3124650 [Thelephora ganbajun]|uniref:Uncharacterized protein n=1 Tax=Thelephora ganbajun TaxID=370292 RepID=A0ACB6YYK4_THEGA|nr:hypothetical protein BDM02DRAFT_3124650 [Thelephora ganbajun]